MTYIEQAFYKANTFTTDKPESFKVFRSEGTSDYVYKKISDSLNKCFSFWSNYLKTPVPLIVLYSNEKSYGWLKDQLDLYNFGDAMPKEERIKQVGDVGVTGGGGTTHIHGEDALFFWQVVGSKGSYTRTGELKTPPHLFAHAVQGLISQQNDVKVTDLPPWFVEGQSDYAALLCISDNFNSFSFHRNNFIRDCYVPGQESKSLLRGYDKDDWYSSLSNCSIPFEGIPLIDEYYSGFFCYERLIYLIGIDGVKELFDRSVGGENFDDVLYDLLGMSKDNFLLEMSYILEDLSDSIMV